MSVFTSRTQKVKIRNVISTADLRQDVEITRLNEYAWGRYDIENNYNGKVGYAKDKSMTGRVTVFSTGKMISTGAKSIAKSTEQLQKTMALLATGEFIKPVQLVPVIRNIVGTMDVKNQIDIKNLALLVPKIIYEPDQFPGAIFRTSEGPVCLIFSTGKVVMVGSKSEKQAFDCANNIANILEKFWV